MKGSPEQQEATRAGIQDLHVPKEFDPSKAFYNKYKHKRKISDPKPSSNDDYHVEDRRRKVSKKVTTPARNKTYNLNLNSKFQYTFPKTQAERQALISRVKADEEREKRQREIVEKRAKEKQAKKTALTWRGKETVYFHRKIHGYHQQRDFKMAIAAYEEMKSMKAPRTIATFGMMINVWKKAPKMLGTTYERIRAEMEEASVPPNLYVYNQLISFAMHERKPKLALDVYHEMLNMAIVPDVITYTTVLGVYSALGKVKEVKELLSKMKEEGIAFDVKVYTSAINVFFSFGDKKAASKLFEEMEEVRLVFYLYCFVDLSDKFCQMGIKTDAKVFNAILKNLANENKLRVDTVEDLLKDMAARGIAPNFATFTILLDFYASQG